MIAPFGNDGLCAAASSANAADAAPTPNHCRASRRPMPCEYVCDISAPTDESVRRVITGVARLRLSMNALSTLTNDASPSARWYATCLAGAAWCERRRVSILAVGGPILIALLVAIARLALHEFPNSGDEYVYLYQAATLADGRLSNPLPPAPDFFTIYYVAQEHGRAFGTFPMGWPLLLALAMSLHIPTSIVNPIVAVSTLVVIYLLGRALYGATTGVLAAALTALSPFFLLDGASYFSHPWCGFLLVSAAYAATLAARRHAAYALLVGFAIGWAVVTRYFTGAVIGLAIVAWLVPRNRPRTLPPSRR